MYHDTDVTIYDVYHDTKPISNESGPILSIVICCVSVHFHIYFSKIVKEITVTNMKIIASDVDLVQYVYMCPEFDDFPPQ